VSIVVRVHKIDPSLEDVGYAHEHDAGFDLRAAEETTLAPGERKCIATGIRVAVPQGYAGLIWDRSGLAARRGLHVFAGVVDAGYRGEVKVVLQNCGKEPFRVERNMRIAQMLVQPVAHARLEFVDTLEETSRGEGGFGSTGRR